jgi:hypothetical protein
MNLFWLLTEGLELDSCAAELNLCFHADNFSEITNLPAGPKNCSTVSLSFPRILKLLLPFTIYHRLAGFSETL